MRAVAVSAAVMTSVLVAFGPVQAQSLPEVLKHAYRNQPALDVARADQRITDELMPQALSGWRPTVIAQGNFAEKASDENTLRTANSNPMSLKIRLSQPLFRGFRTVSATRQADQLIAAGQQQLIIAEQTVFFDVIQAYMDVIRDREILRLRRNQVVLLKRELQ
ncbi:MAG: TolC family protein, partial [Rhizobiales bacterium]|nr:TolC family protein [Hyphomicrobiales bacterium]